ncbi:pantothenate kinase [Chamaesiphon polymorphus]|uniref:Type III pantothenate kinase n=1 Tax=Chamaesiphon polymorphus CCALA 037 TaxID=2107692 RepID=A0A2T1GDA6_9CYAN|nr:pantothenate kinase [Chamaesiphon polymorphus]PSB55408.1 pantothenate kinase [Chamaesiphon polymorphus CCALA 037]
MEAIIDNIQIGLAIGNSRYHWAWFLNTKLQSSWDTEYLTPDRSIESFPVDFQVLIKETQVRVDTIPIYLVSVVPSQTEIWQRLPQTQIITLADIPLQNLYPTLGIDRALAAFGAGEVYGYPVLVIDGGTALTITGIDDRRNFSGGAILPGLRLQIRSLYSGTAALPEITLPQQLPPRWSDNTQGAISSGILHTISAGIRDFIRDWRKLFPESQIVFTGGDGELLVTYLQLDSIALIPFNRYLLFYGLASILY